MSQSTVKMNLTINDRASEVLVKFKQALGDLNGIIKTASSEVDKLSNSFTNLSKTSKEAATNVQAASSAIQGVGKSAKSAAESVDKFASASLKAANDTKQLQDNTNGLTNVFSRIGFAVERLAIEMANLKTSMNGVGSQFSSILNHANNANNGLATHSNRVRQVTQDYNEMSRAMVGAMQMWAANKIGGELKEITKSGVTEEQQQVRMKNAGFTQEQQLGVNQITDEIALSSSGKTMSRTEIRSVVTDMLLENGDIQQVKAMASDLIDGISVLKSNAQANGLDLTNADFNKLTKSLDMKAAFKNQEELKKWLNVTIKSSNVLGPESMSPENIRQTTLYSKGSKDALSEEGMFSLYAASDKLKSSTVGLSFDGFVKKTLGLGLQKNELQGMSDLGLVEKGIVRDKDGEIDLAASKAAGIKVKGSDLLQANPKEWVDKYLRDALIEKGYDVKSATDVREGVSKITQNSNQGALLGDMVLNKESYDRDLSNFRKAKGVDESKLEIDKTSGAAIQDLKKSFDDLYETLATKLAPTITKVFNSLSSFINLLDRLAGENPVAAQLVLMAAAFTSVGLLVNSLITWLGGLSNILRVFGVNVQAGTTIFTLFGTAIRTVIGVLTAFAGPITIAIGLISALYLAFTNWEMIQTAIGMLWDWIKEKFNEGIEFVKTMASEFVDYVGSLFGFENASQAVSDFWEAVKALWTEFTEWVTNAATELANSVAQWFGFTDAASAIDSFKTNASNIWTAIKQTITDIAKETAQAVSSWFNGIINKANETIKKIREVRAEQAREAFAANGGSTKTGSNIYASNPDEYKNMDRDIRKRISGYSDLGIEASSGYRVDLAEKNTTKAMNDAQKKWDSYDVEEMLGEQYGKKDPSFKSSGGGGRKGGGGGSGRAAKQEAEEAKNAVKAMEKQTKDSLATIDSELKNGLISYDQYFFKKKEMITSSINEEIAQLEREKAALIASGNLKGVDKVEKQIETKKNELTQKLQQLENEKSGVALQKKEFELEIEEKLASATGNRHESEIAKLDIEMAKLREKAKLMGASPETMGKIDRIEEIQRAKIEYSELEKRVREYGDTSDLVAKKAASAAKLGGMTATEAANAATEAYREEGKAIEALIPEMERYAQIAGDPTMLKNIEELKIKSHELANQVSEDAKQMKDAMQGNFEGFLNDLSSGKGIKAALKGLGDNIVQTINKTLNKQMSEAITNMLFGKQENGKFTGMFGNFFQGIISKDGFNQGGEGGFGGMMNSIGNWASGLFGGGNQGGEQSQQGGGVGSLAQAATQAGSALLSMTKDGVVGATTALGENIMKTVMGTSVETTATISLQQLAAAAQAAAASLSSMGGGGGMGGGMANLFSGVGEMFSGMLSFDVGADSIPRDMIAQIHKGEMILPAATADKVRKGLAGGSSNAGTPVTNINNFHLAGPTTLQSQQQIASMVGASMNRAVKRNG